MAECGRQAWRFLLLALAVPRGLRSAVEILLGLALLAASTVRLATLARVIWAKEHRTYHTKAATYRLPDPGAHLQPVPRRPGD